MLRSFHERRKAEEGFTLIELMVVVLIIGILVAIALPTFLGARERANDKAAQSGLRNAMAAAKTCFTDEDSYNDATEPCNATKLASIETALTFQANAVGSDDPREVSVSPFTTLVSGSSDNIAMASWSKSETCFTIRDLANAGTQYGDIQNVTLANAPTACDGDAAETDATASEW